MASATSHDIDDYEVLLVAFQNVLGVVVPESQRSCLVSRIEPLLSENKLESLASRAKRLESEQSEEIKSSILNAISIRHSNWSLNPAMADVPQNYKFEKVTEKAKVLIVGSGHGQLAYTIAIQLAEYEQQSNEKKQVSLLAVDSSQSAIEYAQQARYSRQELTGLSEAYKNLYTTASDDEHRKIKDKIRQTVHFSQCDLTQDFQSLGEVDLIICPDVLVYFSNEVKEGILQQFSTLLKAGGIFVTGGNQAVTPLIQGFERVEHPSGVFYRNKQ